MGNQEIIKTMETGKIEPVNVLERLNQGENFAEIMQSLPAEAFEKKSQCACCSDGRFMPHDANMEKTGLAGQGILLLFNSPELNNFIADLKDRADKPRAIASHISCGAAGLAYKKLQDMIQHEETAAVNEVFNFLGITSLPESSDKLGEIYTQKLADLVGADYYHMGEFLGDTDHAESGVIISAIDFDERYIKLPTQQFFNSASAKFGVSDDYLKTEISALTNIAFHHGKMDAHAASYKAEDKFYLLIIADPAQAERLQLIANEVAANPEWQGKVKVEVFAKTDWNLN